MAEPDAKKVFETFFVRYRNLNDPEFVLSAGLREIKHLTDMYGIDLEQLLARSVSPNALQRMIDEALDQYVKDVIAKIGRRASVPRFVQSRTRLVDSLLQWWNGNAARLASMNANNLYSKAAQFRMLSEASMIPQEYIDKVAEYTIESVTINGRTYNKRSLASLWERMTDAYGATDTIQYRNGVNYPLAAYVEQRATTTKVEAARLATLTASAADGMLFVTTNKTGTMDSCIYYEGKLMFINDEARKQARKLFGNLPEFKRIPTWGEVVAGPTHMGGFGCRHELRPVPIHLYSKERALNTIARMAPGEVPKKINENEIKKRLMKKRRR
jgi:hypothetical protein